jgi:N-acyl-L-homoserine lactone synthetase
MIIHVETHDRLRHARELAGYFRLRKTVFHDRLGWNVTVQEDEERDVLDDLPCTYALSLDEGGAVNAGARLIPTTQTTLLDLAFDGLVPEGISFRAPTIWEVSRLCIDDRYAGERLSAGLAMANLELALANFDYARRNGITHYLTVTEQRVYELTQVFDLGVELLGRQTIDGCAVVCGLIAIDDRSLAAAERMRPLTRARPLSGKDATSHGLAPAVPRPGRGTSEPTRRSPRG